MGRPKSDDVIPQTKKEADKLLVKQLHDYFSKTGLTPNGTKKIYKYGIAQWAHDRKVHRFFLIGWNGTIYLYSDKSWKKVVRND